MLFWVPVDPETIPHNQHTLFCGVVGDVATKLHPQYTLQNGV